MSSTPWPPAWTASRVARPARDLVRSGAFYGELLGLLPRGGFQDHDGYDGVFFALPGGGELELTRGPVEPVAATEEDLLVLYLGSSAAVAAVGARLSARGVERVDSPNPYWNRFGQTFLDPDGYRVVIAARDDRPAERVEIGVHTGDRRELRPLFELAEDSAEQLGAYLDLGEVVVARRAGRLIGHLQLVPAADPGEIELKNMAVDPGEQGTGVGRALVAAAVERCRAGGWTRLLVATAAADAGNLRFYQRVGFRMVSVEPDAFTPDTGYPDPIEIDGIPLRDRVWFARTLVGAAAASGEPVTGSAPGGS